MTSLRRCSKKRLNLGAMSPEDRPEVSLHREDPDEAWYELKVVDNVDADEWAELVRLGKVVDELRDVLIDEMDEATIQMLGENLREQVRVVVYSRPEPSSPPRRS